MAAVSKTLGYTRKEFYFDDLIEYIGSLNKRSIFKKRPRKEDKAEMMFLAQTLLHFHPR